MDSTRAPAAPEPRVPADEPADSGMRLTAANWCDVVARLGLKGVANELAQNCVYVGEAEGQVRLTLDSACKQLYSKAREQGLAKALAGLLGYPLQVHIEIAAVTQETPARRQVRASDERQQAAVQAIKEDANVKALEDAFGAQVHNDSIRPLDS